jgi:glycosyltransferase involved in cell wall biosynthesis
VRVLIVRQHFGAVGHGSSARGEQFAARLAAEGHEVTVLAGLSGEDVISVPNLRVLRLGVPYSIDMSFARRKWSFIEFTLKAMVHVMRHRYDVIFASSTPLTVFVPALLGKAIRWGKPRVVLEIRDLWPAIPIALGALSRPEALIARALEGASYRFADEIIALSPGMAEEIGRSSGRASVVITNGSSRADFEGFEREQARAALGIPQDAKVVLYAGTLGVINDIPYLAALANHATVVDLSILFLVVGDGPKRDELLAAVADNPRVRYVQRVPRSEVACYFAAADVSLVTFGDVELMDTNSANKFFDSLAAGLPVALNYKGWQADLIEDACCGVTLGRDPAGAAVILSRLLDDPDHLATMRAASSGLSEQFEWDVLFPRWRDAVVGASTQAHG